MNNSIIFYYSHTGNNKFIAQDLAGKLKCKAEDIKPFPKAFGVNLFLTFFNIGSGIKKLENNPADYDRVIVLSPIWMGHLVSPVRGFFKKYGDKVSNFVYITVCGGGEEDNKTKFGYEKVHETANQLVDGKVSKAHALSLKHIIKDEGIKEEDMMGVRLSEKRMRGSFKNSYDKIVKDLKK